MKNVPAALQAHLDNNVTTTCRLLRIQTADSPPVVLGFTTLDRSIEYDDGDGLVTYSSLNGFDPTALRNDTGYSIDNAEAYALISDDVEPGITVEDVEGGLFDDATWKAYLVNFENLSDGHVLLDAGDVGPVRVRYGMVWMPELLSHIIRTRQPIGHVDSISCRAEFGSPAASQTGCGVDAESLWVHGVVTSVGAETDRIFDAEVDTGLVRTPVPGRLRWLTGDNANPRLTWVEAFDDSGSPVEVTLGEPTQRPVQVGDEFEIRPDCGKLYLQWCIGVWDNGPNFKGEPYIPIGDASQIQTPGAQLPGAGGFVGTTPPDEDSP